MTHEPQPKSQYTWAKCREPFKRQLECFANHWIDGSWSIERVALELCAVTYWGIPGHLQAQSLSVSEMSLRDVRRQTQILGLAILDEGMADGPRTPEDRLNVLKGYVAASEVENGPTVN